MYILVKYYLECLKRIKEGKAIISDYNHINFLQTFFGQEPDEADGQ